MAGSLLLKLASALFAMMVVAAPSAEALSCGEVVSKLTPCLSYLRSGGAVPPACCDGVRKLNAAATTTPLRQAACTCMKQAAAGNSGIQQGFASALPGKCGVSIPYPISASVDCSKVK